MMARRWLHIVAACLLAVVAQSCEHHTDKHNHPALKQVSRDDILEQKALPVYGYRVVHSYQHDTSSYTEGLLLDGGFLYEGTGRYGQSRLLKLDLATGKALKSHDLAPQWFGEGVTILGEEIFQLTYISNTGFVYDKNSFAPKRTFQYATQGWGLTTDGTHLIMSDGSAALHFMDPRTLKEMKHVIVSSPAGPVGWLNELEYVDGQIYANVWQSSLIVRISAEDGRVTGWIDLTGINPDPGKLKYPYVLNGIAYRKDTRRLLVAGKCWPVIYEIELIPLKP